MGKDKALLPFRGRTLVECVAQVVKEAAGSVTLVGPLERYSSLGLPVIEDRYPGCGPLGGIHAALEHSAAELTLITACDMPYLTVDFLKWIAANAECEEADAVLPCGPSGRPEPLCSIYRRTCLSPITSALFSHRFKVTDALAGLRITLLPLTGLSPLVNANTPQDWTEVNHG